MSRGSPPRHEKAVPYPARSDGGQVAGLRWCCEPASECGPRASKAPPTVAPPGEARTADAARGRPPPAAVVHGRPTMEAVYERCCGIDVHKRSVTACVLISGPGAVVAKEVRTFGTMTEDLLALGDWLAGHGVTHVAMESTGVYWKPLWNLFEDRFALLLVNAAHVK